MTFNLELDLDLGLTIATCLNSLMNCSIVVNITKFIHSGENVYGYVS